MEKTSKPLIVIIDDNAQEAEALSKFLSETYEIVSVENEQDALYIFESLQMKIRIVLLNMNTFKIDTLQLMSKMKEINSMPEIIAFADYEEINCCVEAMKEGAYDYMIKPFDKNGLLITIENVLENMDMESKFEEHTRSNYMSDIDNDNFSLSEIKKLLHKKHLEGETLSQEELLKLISEKNNIDIHTEETKEKEKPKILIVEDEEDARINLKIFLKKKYDPYLAKDGETALNYINDSKFKPDIILLDIYLPDTTGLELLPEIKAKKPNSDVIIMTAYREIHVAVKTLREGASDYINKPFLKIDLLSTIAKVLQKRYISNVIPELREKIIHKLPYERKITLLSERYKILKHQNKLLRMSEVYSFFPELKESNIAEDFLLPTQLTEKGIDKFIEKLSTTTKVTKNH